MADSMHRHDEAAAALAAEIVRYALHRVSLDPVPLDGPRPATELQAATGPTVTPQGIGGHEALRLWAEVLAPACISVDHPRYLAFVPAAPTEASILFDLVVGACNIYAGSFLDASGAIHAENEALRWVADLAGFPAPAGGVFVTGGTAGNLAALVAARHRWRQRADGAFDRTRGMVIASGGAHSSIVSAARVMDVDVLEVGTDESGRLTRAAVEGLVEHLTPVQRARVFAVVATCGTTNAGVLDDLAAAADAAAAIGAWFHVDGAYGGAALVSPAVRERARGVERADSFIVDPHKWLFAPFDCCALIYRDPELARAAHTQQAEYLDVYHQGGEWNPSDFAHHLTRRARGLPFWFSLATYGTDAYRHAVERGLELAQDAARLIRAAAHVELVNEPDLSVVLFRRLGWSPEEYQRWSERILAEGLAYVVPTSWQGETVARFCFVNPNTTVDDIAVILTSME